MNIIGLVAVWNELISHGDAVFTAPTRQIWQQMARGWVLRRGPATVTHILRVLGQRADRHWTAYHRFFYRAVWSREALCLRILVQVIGPLIRQSGRIDPATGQPEADLVLDETTAGRYGKHVAHAGWYHDASASGPGHKGRVTHWANLWVVGAVVLRLEAWPLLRWVLPVIFSLHHKRSQATPEHPFETVMARAGQMVRAVAQALPDVRWWVPTDGNYAKRPFVQILPPTVRLVSRLRRNATLFALPPVRQKLGRGCGRRRKKGKELPKPRHLAARRKKGWRRVTLQRQGHTAERDLLGITCLWPRVCGYRPIRVVIVRDPAGREKDDFAFCTDATETDERIVQRFFDRWGIEEGIFEAKQMMGFEDTRGWCLKTVQRQAPVAMLLVTLVKAWYIRCAPGEPALRPETTPWYPDKAQASFADMLAALRNVLWQHHLNSTLGFIPQMQQWWKRLSYALSAA